MLRPRRGGRKRPEIACAVGEGIDIISVRRVEALLERQGERFLTRCFTPREIQHCSGSARPAECYAARLAAKEAVSKSLRNTWPQGVAWREVEIIRHPQGAPGVVLGGSVRTLARRRHVDKILVSMSHCGDYAVASATVLSRARAGFRRRAGRL